MTVQPPPTVVIPPDPVIEAYKRDVDRTLLQENLKRSTDERMQALAEMARLVEELHADRKAMRQRA